MSILEPIKKGFSVAKNSLDLVLSLFVVGVAWNLTNFFMTSRLQQPEPSVRASMGMALVGFAFILVSFFIQGGSMGYVLDRIKAGKASLASFFAAGQKFYAKLLLLGILVSLIIFVFVFLAMLPAILLRGNVDTLGVIIAIIFAGIGIYFVLLLFFAPYFIVAEGEKVMASVKQSIALVRNNLISVLGLTLLLIVIGFAFGVILGLLLAGLDAAIKGTPAQIVFAVISSLVNAFLGVVVTASFMTLYLSLSNNNTRGA